MGLGLTLALAEGARINVPCVLLTCLRLYARGRRQWRLDDAFVCLGCIWMISGTAAEIVLGIHSGLADATRVVLSYTSYVSLLCTVWSCRLSMLHSIARATPRSCSQKHKATLPIIFVALCALEVGHVGWECSPAAVLSSSLLPQCFSKAEITFCQLITTVFTARSLLFLPFRTILSLTNGSPLIRNRLSLVLLASTCMITLSVMTCLVGLDIKPQGFTHDDLRSYEAYMSLVFCNLPVLVVAVCHAIGVEDFSGESFDVFKPGDHPPIDSPSPPERRRISFSRVVTSFREGVRDFDDQCMAELEVEYALQQELPAAQHNEAPSAATKGVVGAANAVW